MKNITEPCGCKISDYGGNDICTWMCQEHYKEKVEMMGYKFNKEADDKFLQEKEQ